MHVDGTSLCHQSPRLLTNCFLGTEDEGALWAFILGLRQIFADFKQVEPNHAVFPAIDKLLDDRRKTWANSNAPSSKELAKMVDKYRDEGGANAEGAGGEC